MAQPKADQIELAEKLQDLWLREMKQRLESGAATSTDLATLARVLENNGWTIDPADLPTDLREHITTEVSFDDDAEDDDKLEVV